MIQTMQFNSVWRFAIAIGIPTLLVIALAILPLASYIGYAAWQPNAIVLLVMRAFLMASAGYLVIRRVSNNLWAAAVAGLIVFLVEQIGVFGLWFVLNGQFDSAVRTFYAFAMLSWVAMILGTLGGIAGRMRDSRRRD